MKFSGQKFVVVGLGKSGTAAASALLRRGANVLVLDENASAMCSLSHANLQIHTGPFPSNFWQGARAVVVSPGVPLSKPELVYARERGAEFISEIDLAWHLMPQKSGAILGVTGTNGKSTTTALLGVLAGQAFRRVFVGGNLGTAFCLAYEDPSTPPFDLHVIELSSFQLESTHGAQFLGAALLNLTPDHLDRYPTSREYGLAKARIFERQPANGFAVCNADDEQVVALSRAAQVPIHGFTLRADARQGTFASLARGVEGSISLAPDAEPLVIRSRSLRGAHNVQNAMAATLMAKHVGTNHAQLQHGIDSFSGLPHRLEFVALENGVEWINDSKATNVDSAVVALKALSNRVWLIAGGLGKGASYDPLVLAAKHKVRGVLTIGADASSIAAAFTGVCPVYDCGTLETAVARASTIAESGDSILLSPACASYDQFDNFEHRGTQFKKAVRALMEKRVEAR